MRFRMRSRRLAALAGFAALALSQQKRSVWDGVFTAEQATRGQARYNQQCASCHGDTLMGGESAPPLAGGEFLSTWNGLTAGELLVGVRSDAPGVGAHELELERRGTRVEYQDVHAGTRPSRMAASFAASMFPPDTTQTTLPATRCLSAAARDDPPAPSATTRARSANSFTD